MAMNKRKRINEIAGVEKAPTGIVGFDSIIGGGLPRGRTTLVLGGTGAGKTVFSLQVLVGGMRQHGEPGMCISMEEDVQQMIVNTAGFGWDVPRLIREHKFFFIDARLGPGIVKAGAFDLTGLLAEIKAQADKIGARRIVFDSLDSLLTLLDDPKAERQELYRLRDWLAENDLTGIINVHSEAGLAPFPRYGFLQFMVDCVVVLDNHMVGDHFSRTLRIVKCRGCRFSGNEFPMLIDSGGIQIAVGPQKSDYAVSSKRVSTGMGRLDDMLRGGYYRGSSVLITGAPGSAKSTLVGAFLEAACRRGERALYVGFDEVAGAILRNLASVAVKLEPYMKSGLLRVHAVRAEDQRAEQHFAKIAALLREQKPRCLGIDPISALLQSGPRQVAIRMTKHLLDLAKVEQITVVCTSLLESINVQSEATPLQVSTIADTWIHLSFAIHAGERNRALTVIKSRGTGHSNQVRELVLSDEGISLADVYSAGGEVLMGTLRWEKEIADELERLRARTEMERRRRELELAEAEAASHAELSTRELKARRVELALLQREQELLEKRWTEDPKQRLKVRSGNKAAPTEVPSTTRYTVAALEAVHSARRHNPKRSRN